MPSIIRPQLATFSPPPVTNEDLDWADLAVIDLSKASDPDSQAELTKKVCDAMHNQGFFYVINHGWTAEQTARMFDIANLAFTGVSEEQKQKYSSNLKTTGSFQGYKPRQYWNIDNGVKDQIEIFGINHQVTLREHPEALRPFLPEIEALARHTHFDVIHPILRMLAKGLELPEDTLVDIHPFESPSETPIYEIVCYRRSQEDEQKAKNVWLKGHTGDPGSVDIGSITVLYSQPVTALQFLGKDGKWRWVRHIENAMVINLGDCMEFLSGGYYKATLHRVVQPPEDQRVYDRLGLFYFLLAHDDVPLVPFSQSPVLQRVGIEYREGIAKEAQEPGLTVSAWRKHRTSVAQNLKSLTPTLRVHNVINLKDMLNKFNLK
ncbi:Flavonol synthase/flavanone 3-hydroxylase [Mycena indigotica]|uniref:Flavonol synthase/flavanone 3-hydroxylase n=1 Tax=Mycena indigotica TaxID=2126181 RepID=A0A8H6SH73_9AGAR|nr:Flavonol synthase/flavanone 3-hydroxylase [Mycena indigotica]KAF7298740.1 Flavonol synthase/flavanone 3-hydroxylase [Mycena indigotica]